MWASVRSPIASMQPFSRMWMKRSWHRIRRRTRRWQGRRWNTPRSLGNRGTFYTTGIEHSPTSATGTAWERTPWHATQRAAWEALKRAVVALIADLDAFLSGASSLQGSRLGRRDRLRLDDVYGQRSTRTGWNTAPRALARCVYIVEGGSLARRRAHPRSLSTNWARPFLRRGWPTRSRALG